MNNKYKKQVRVAMAVALAVTSIAHSTGNLFAQSEDTINENTLIDIEEIEKENIEAKNLETILEESLENKESIQHVEKAVGDIEINEVNFPDAAFREYLRTGSWKDPLGEYKYDWDGDGILSSRELEMIREINVNGNQNITSLQGIEHFPKLWYLYCTNTSITSIDVNKNQELRWLDVSNNRHLRFVYCDSNPILELRMNNVPELTGFSCNLDFFFLDDDAQKAYTNLAWLHIGDRMPVLIIGGLNTTNNLGGVGSTFNIKDKFPGIDLNRIQRISGATLNKSTGVVSGYVEGTPIRYTYDCGQSVDLNVTLNFTIKGMSSIIINDNLDKEYDGVAVAEPTSIIKAGSNGAVTFEWYQADGTKLQDAPTEAGSYKVKAILAEDNQYIGAEAVKDFTITKAKNAWTEELSIQDWTYGATANSPSAKAQFGVVEYTYSTSKDGAYTTQVPSNAGTYWVKATVTEAGNYEGLEATKSFSIGKANSTITINDNLNKEYDGVAVEEPKDIAITGSQGTKTIEWYTATGQQLNDAPVNAGSYRVKVILEADVNYAGAEAVKDFTITKAKNTWTEELSIQDWTYGATANSPSAKAQFGVVEYTYSTSKDGAYTTQVPSNAGTYWVKATVTEAGNYEGLEATKSFSIGKANSTITINDNLNKEYDGVAVEEPKDIAITGSQGTKTIEWYTATGQQLNDAPVNAGSYRVKVILEADVNYAGAEAVKDFTITKAKNTWTEELSIQDWVYGATANNPSARAQFGTVEYTYSTSENGAYTTQVPSNVGTYWIKATVTETDNYEGLEATQSFSIGKAGSTITIDDNLDKEYDGIAVADPINITKTGSTGAVSFEWYTLDGKQLQTAPINAGNYKVKAILAGDANYLGAEAVKDFTIKKAMNQWKQELSIQGWVYGATPNNPSVEAQFGIVEYTYSTAEDGVYTTEVPSDAGTYWVKASVIDTDSYAGLEAKKAFTIAKASSMITMDSDLNKVYDGQPVSEPQVTVTGSTGAITYEWYKKEESTTRAIAWTQLTEAPREVGNYKVVVIVAGDENYEGVTVEKEFSILAEESVEFIPGQEVTGVQTGDGTQVGLWTMLVGLSTGMMMFFRKKNRKEEA